MTPERLALEQPGAQAAAAVARLLVTADSLTAAAVDAEGDYSDWLIRCGLYADRCSSLLSTVLTGEYTDTDLADLLNGEKLAFATWKLFSEYAFRATGDARYQAVNWARLALFWYADTHLIRVEFAPNATIGLLPSGLASIAIRTEAQAVIATLKQDSLVWDDQGTFIGREDWNLPQFLSVLLGYTA